MKTETKPETHMLKNPNFHEIIELEKLGWSVVNDIVEDGDRKVTLERKPAEASIQRPAQVSEPTGASVGECGAEPKEKTAPKKRS